MISSLRKTFLHILFLTSLATSVHGTCYVVSNRCEFPFTHEDRTYFSCISIQPPPTSEASEDYDLAKVKEDSYCQISLGGLKAWGNCSDGCFDDLNNRMEFGGESGDGSLAVFCKNTPAQCVFPFKYNGVEYTSCTTEGMDQSEGEKKWCATKVDADGNMVDGMFGICDNCSDEVAPVDETPEGPESQVSEPKHICVTITPESNPSGISGKITFMQQDENAKMRIKGHLAGLPVGFHGFHVHENPTLGNNCVDAGMHFNPFNKTHGSHDSAERHVGDFGNIEADSDGLANLDIEVSDASIFAGENSILGLPFVIHADEDDLGLNPESDQSLTTGTSGGRLVCALIQEPTVEEDNTLLIIIIVVVVLLLLLILLTILICYCIKKRKSKIREKVPYDDPGFDYPNGDACKKSPLYDELSIPFIDASPAPTPKAGRSTERLSFFNRTPSIGRSRGSLSNDDK